MYTDSSLCIVLGDEKNTQGIILLEFIRGRFTDLQGFIF